MDEFHRLYGNKSNLGTTIANFGQVVKSTQELEIDQITAKTNEQKKLIEDLTKQISDAKAIRVTLKETVYSLKHKKYVLENGDELAGAIKSLVAVLTPIVEVVETVIYVEEKVVVVEEVVPDLVIVGKKIDVDVKAETVVAEVVEEVIVDDTKKKEKEVEVEVEIE